MELLLLILLFLILYPLLSFAFRVWRQVNHIKKQFGDIRSQYENARKAQSDYYRRGYDDEDDDADSRASRTSYVQRIGEYVEYEEIVEERDAGVYDPGTPVEPRITDAKFEEIG